MQITTSLVLAAISASHLVAAAALPLSHPDEVRENGHRPRDISITIAQSLFENPSTKGCAKPGDNYGCFTPGITGGWCWKRVSLLSHSSL
jgi:hypothetical protein